MTRRARLIVMMVRSSGIQAIANALAALIATRVLAVADRGIMVVALTIPALLVPILVVGTGNTLRNRFPLTNDADRATLLGAFGRASALSATLGTAVTVVVTLALASQLGGQLRELPILLSIAASTFCMILIYQLTELWFAAGEFQRGADWAAYAAIIGLVGMCAAILIGRSPAGLILGQSVGMLLVAFSAILSLNKFSLVQFRGANWRQTWHHVRSGSMSIGHPIGRSVLLRSDRLILASLAGPETVAVYALASTVAEAVRLAPTAVSQLVTHDVASGGGWTSARQAQVVAIGSVVLVGLPLLVAGVFSFGPLFGQAYRDSVPLLGILLIAELGFTLLGVSQRGLIGGGWNWEVSVLGIVGGAVSLPVYWFSAHHFGAAGCAWGVVGLYCILGVTGTWLLRRRLANTIPEPIERGTT